MNGIRAFLPIALVLPISCINTPQRFYSGERPGSDVAVVRAHGASLREVNGQPVRRDASEAHLAPGSNVILLSINASNFNAREPEDRRLYRLDLVAEPGASYVVTGRRGEARWCAWPVDRKSGQTVFQTPGACVTRQ